MKKRLLALCLAAALLLGMMPALTLPTKAVETVTDVKTLDITTGTATGIGYSSSTSDDIWYRVNVLRYSNNCTWSGTKQEIPNLSFDHTKEVLLEQYLYVNSIASGKDASVEGYITVGQGHLQLSKCVGYTLMDADRESFLYYCLTGDAETSNFQVRFLKEDNTMEDINLGINGFGADNYFWLGIRWNVDDTVTVLVNGDEKGTTTVPVTWKVDSTAELGKKYNPEGYLANGTKVSGCDFLTIKSNQIDVLVQDTEECPTKISTTEYLPAKLEGIFTSEALTANSDLSESSWSNANFVEVADGISAAVLVNKGDAYVALRGTNGTYDVTLGGIEESVIVNNNVGEVKIGNIGLTNYGETRELTVGTAKATVTFAAKKVNTELVGSVDAQIDVSVGHDCPTSRSTNSAFVNGDYINVRHIEKSYGNWYKNPTKAGGTDVAFDHTQNVKINLPLRFHETFFTQYPNSLYVDDAGKLAVNNNGTYNNIMVFTFKDYETGAFIYAYLTADAERDIQLGFLLNDRTTNETVDVGINNSNPDSNIGVMGLYSDTDENPYNGVYLIWNVDGSVTVMKGDQELDTIENATWTADSNATAGTAVNPLPAAACAGYDFIHYETYSVGGWYAEGATNGIAGCNGALQAYLYDMTITTTPATLDITTTVAEDLAAKVEADLGDLNDVAALPQAVEHDALGTVALTWSDTAELVNNNVLTIPSEDTVTTLTAMAGEATVWSGEVTVKAADPIVGVFTPEDLTSGAESWSLVPFTQLNYSTDSVAVLATDINTVYVAVKSADSSATVILNGDEKEVAIDDGMGVVKFENVGLSAYGNARTIKVTTSTGSLDTKVLFNATEVKLPYINTHKVDMHTNGAYATVDTENPAYIAFAGGTGIKYTEKSGSYGDVVIDRSKDVTIDLQMTFQEEAFTNSMATLSAAESNNAMEWSVNNFVLFAPYDSVTNTHFLAYFTADAEYDLYLRFFLKDKTTADVDLGKNIKDTDGKITAIDLQTLQLVWNTDGSVTVKLDGKELQTVQNATWDTITSKGAGYVDNPGGWSNNDYYRVLSVRDGASYRAYLWGLSFSTPEEGSVQAFEPAAIKASNATLSSDVGLNFWLNDVGGAALTLEHNGTPKTFYTSEMTASDNGLLKASLNLAAAQMADDVKYTLVDAYGMTTTGTTSVEDYAAGALNDENNNASVKDMINAMLNYGYHAKAYFEYDIENAMNAVAAPVLGILTEVADTKYDRVVNNGLEGIKATGATLRLEDQVKIRFYFTGDITAYEVTGGKAVYDEANDRYYVDIAVAPKNLDEMYTVEVTDGTNTTSVSYGCMTYLLAKANDPELGDLMQAMYIYSQAAEAYNP